MDTRNQAPMLTVETITPVIAATSCFINMLNNRFLKEAHSAWDGYNILRRWYCGECVYVVSENTSKQISNEELLHHLDSTILTEHGFFFKSILQDNLRLHNIIKQLPAAQSAELLVKICRNLRRTSEKAIKQFIALLEPEALMEALEKLEQINKKIQAAYLAEKIILLKTYVGSTPPRSTDSDA